MFTAQDGVYTIHNLIWNETGKFLYLN